MSQKTTNDRVWSKLNKKLLGAFEKHDWPLMKSIYYDQALLLQKEGRDSFRFVHESAKSELSGIQGKTIEHVEIIAPIGTCPVCAELGKRSYKLGDIVKDQPLPVKECENKSCRCSYAPVIEEPALES